MVLLAELHVDHVGDAERVLEDVRPVGEELPDLGGALEVEAVVVPHPVRVEPVLLEADAEEDVVRLVILGAKEVRVVRGHDRQADGLGQLEDLGVQLALVAGGVGLHLEEVPVLEDLGVPGGDRLGVVEAVGQQVRRDLPGHAGAGDDDAGVVAGEDLAVDARLAVESLGVPDRGELDQVAVALEVTGEQHEVVVRPLAGGVAGALAPVARGDVRLHADDRLHARLARLLLKFPGRVQIAVVRDGQGGLFELLRPGNQVFDPVRAVEERILGMAVQVYEAHRNPLR